MSLDFSRYGIRNTIKYRETSSVIDKPRTGRPKKLLNKDEQYLKIISLRKRKKTSIELTTELAEGSGVVFHPSIVRRALFKLGLKGRVVGRKPLLRK